MDSRIIELQEQIRRCEEEIDKIRNSCEHPSYYLGLYMWAPGHMHPSRICEECGTPLGGITEEEIERVNKESGLGYLESDSNIVEDNSTEDDYSYEVTSINRGVSG